VVACCIMSGGHRKRGGSFHLQDLDAAEETDHDVQFVTPYFDESSMPEPLDLSKLCLDDDLFDKGDNNSSGSVAAEGMQTRGRSRSRSVHENDLAAPGYLPDSNLSNSTDSAPGGSGNIIPPRQKRQSAGGGSSGAQSNGGEEKAGRRGGPLQHREVQALKKGLEEANQSINRNQNREDEEERMAADAEKRKRLLLSNSNLASNNAATATRRVKLLMLGDSGVGKSSLIMRWTLDTFSPSLVSTVGVNFKSRKVSIANEAVQVQVWDTAGQEQFHKITTSYYKGAQGIMLVYDVTDPSSLANIEYWIKNIKSHATDTVQVALIGNKTDLRGGSSSPTTTCETERGQDIAHKFGIPFFETSAKESLNVDIAFLTLVEHIMESGGSISTAHSANPGLGHQPGPTQHSSSSISSSNTASSSSSSSSSSTISGLTPRSIVEKAGEKARLFGGAFKRSSSAKGASSHNNGGGNSPPGSNNNSSSSSSSGGSVGSGGASEKSGGGNADGDEKEKCTIS